MHVIILKLRQGFYINMYLALIANGNICIHDKSFT